MSGGIGQGECWHFYVEMGLEMLGLVGWRPGEEESPRISAMTQRGKAATKEENIGHGPARMATDMALAIRAGPWQQTRFLAS